MSNSCSPVGWVGAALLGWMGLALSESLSTTAAMSCHAWKIKACLELSLMAASICIIIIIMVFSFFLHRNGIGLEFAEAR